MPNKLIHKSRTSLQSCRTTLKIKQKPYCTSRTLVKLLASFLEIMSYLVSSIHLSLYERFIKQAGIVIWHMKKSQPTPSHKSWCMMAITTIECYFSRWYTIIQTSLMIHPSVTGMHKSLLMVGAQEMMMRRHYSTNVASS
jgi:hypothetical protein